MNALLLGATGLIGNETLSLLRTDARFGHVLVLARRDGASEGKVEWRTVDFGSDAPYAALQADPIDVVLCCLGTTMKQAGSRDAFRFVDHGIPMRVASALRPRASEIRFGLVSAVGANPRSAVFYSRTKGELERDLEAIGFGSLEILRPSLLLGHREAGRRGERVAEAVMGPLGAVMVGPLARYRAIAARDVARALIAAVTRPPKAPVGVHLYADMMQR